MKLPRILVLSLVLTACSTPAPAPPPVIVTVDDDHRWVTDDEFQHSAWAALPATSSWRAEPDGATVVLSDGRALRLSFAAPAVVRWWVPAAAGDLPFSPGAVYPPLKGLTLKIKEADGTIFMDTPSLGVRLRLKDLAWTIIRGDKTVLSGLPPRAAGRRLLQPFASKDAVHWLGLGAGSGPFWVGVPIGTGSVAAPALWGLGGSVPFELALDNSYQTYTRIGEEVSIGALNGGLDLLIAAAPDPGSVVEAMTGILGRPGIPPRWAHGTALELPETEPGTFARQAKLSIETATGRGSHPTFRSLLLSNPGESLSAGGFVLPPLPGRRDWNSFVPDNGVDAPIARMNNRLPTIEAARVDSLWRAQNPGRPYLLSGSAAWGTIRYAQGSVAVEGGKPVLGDVLLRGALGLGTPAITLDLQALISPETRPAAYQLLLNWMLNPYLILNWGSDPAGLWKNLPELDRKRLKAILDRRSEFKPLFIQLAREAALTGRPAWRPLWFAGASDEAFAADEFLLGDSLLAAPVSGTKRSVYLPGPGVWFDFWSGEEYGGGRSYDVEARLDKPLLFARGGAVVPIREAEAFSDEDVYNPLTVHVFPGGRGFGTYYADDGRTEAWKNGTYWETRLVYDFSQKDMSLEHIPINTVGGVKPDPYLLYRIHNIFRPKQVKVDGKAVPLYGDSWGITDSDRTSAWYESDHTLLIKTFKPEKAQLITVTF